MIRSAFTLLVWAMAAPAYATQWTCQAHPKTPNHVLYPVPAQFLLVLADEKFSLSPLVRRASGEFSGRGHWTTVEDQIALIGRSTVSWNDPILRGPQTLEQEIRAFSILNEPNDLVLSALNTDGRRATVHCTPKES